MQCPSDNNYMIYKENAEDKNSNELTNNNNLNSNLNQTKET